MAPRSIDKDEKARKIIEHATKVFAAKGYNATTIDDIAIKAKIAKGSVYQYFRSKRDLFLAVFDAWSRQYFEAMEAQASGQHASAAEQLRQTSRAAYVLGKQAMDLVPLMFEFWAASASPETREQVAGMFRRLYGVFRELVGGMIQRGIDQGEFRSDVDVESTAALLVGSMDGLFLQAWFDERMDPEKAGMAFIDALVRGLRK